MKALTLTQPWATLVAAGEKTVETRSWLTHYRGPLAIHAAKNYPVWACELALKPPFAAAVHRIFGDEAPAFPLGAVVAVVELVECVRIDALPPTWTPQPSSDEYAFGDYSLGRFMFRFATILPLTEVIPARGALGIWSWDAPWEARR
jgi:hypothetical protein